MNAARRTWPGRPFFRRKGQEAGSIPVLIVGAGPAGLCLAIDLLRRQIPCRIIEKRATPNGASRGKGLQPRTLEMFEDLGVLEAIQSLGGEYPLIRAYEERTVLGESFMHERRSPPPDRPFMNILMVSQANTEAALRDRLRVLGGAVEFDHELVALSQDDRGVNATIRTNGELADVRALYVVGADGGRSAIRDLLGVRFLGVTDNQERMLFGDVKVTGMDRSVWRAWPKAPGGFLALCPIPHTEVFQFVAHLEPSDTEATADFQDVFWRRTGWTEVRLEGTDWKSIYTLNERLAEHYRKGRVFLAGDAAHVHSAAGGQGLNTSVQDSYNLGWKLGEVLRGGKEKLLDSYEQERRPVAENVLNLSAKLHRAGAGDDHEDRRDPAISELDLSYRKSSATQDHSQHLGRVRPGDRAPDAPCIDLRGSPRRLFEMFQGPHFTLLAFGLRERELRRIPRFKSVETRVVTIGLGGDRTGFSLLDSGAHAATAYDARGGSVFLIRPDGYVASIGDSADHVDQHLVFAADNVSG